MKYAKLSSFLLSFILSPAIGQAQTILEAGSGIADIHFHNEYPGGQLTFAWVPIKYYLEPRLSLSPDKPSVCKILDFKDIQIELWGLFTGGRVWQSMPATVEHLESGDRLAAQLPVPYGYTTYGVKGYMRVKCSNTPAGESVKIYAYNTNIDNSHAWSDSFKLGLDPERTVRLVFSNSGELGALRKNSRYSFPLFSESKGNSSIPHKIYVDGKLLDKPVNITKEDSDYQLSIDKSGSMTVVTGEKEGDFNQTINFKVIIE